MSALEQAYQWPRKPPRWWWYRNDSRDRPYHMGLRWRWRRWRGSTVNTYSAAVWPARGRWHLRVAVAEVQAENMRDAVAMLVHHPNVAAALAEEDPRIVPGEYHCSEDHETADTWPREALVAVYTDDEVIFEHPSIHISEGDLGASYALER